MLVMRRGVDGILMYWAYSLLQVVMLDLHNS
jgi:hypothetical protein